MVRRLLAVALAAQGALAFNIGVPSAPYGVAAIPRAALFLDE